MTSTKLIRKIDRNRITDQEVLNELQEMPELECYRAVIWLVYQTRQRIKKLMWYVGNNKALYNKVLRYICNLPAHKVNGFEEYDELRDSTHELVCCVA
jgi:hypothetical protein